MKYKVVCKALAIARHAGARTLVVAGMLAVALQAGSEPSSWTINGKSQIKDFAAKVAEITGKTVVLSANVKNSEVTVISNVSLDADSVYKLFVTVLRVHGLAVVENDGVISVVNLQNARQSPGPIDIEEGQPPDILITKVVSLDYVRSADLMKIVRPLIPQTSIVVSIEEPNVLVVADHVANVQRIIKLIEQIDVVDKDDLVHWPLKHAWVGTVARVLEEMAPEQIGRGAKGPQSVQIIANERDNSLILKGKAHAVAEVLRLVEKLDVADQTGSSARVIHLNYADAASVASIMERLVDVAGEGGGNGPTAIIQADETLNALIVRADPATMNFVLGTLGELDVRRAQVLIEAAIVEVSINTVDQHGTEFMAGDQRGSAVPLLSTTLNGIVGSVLRRAGGDESTLGFDPATVVSGFASPTLALAKLDPDGIAFGAIISALATDTRANLLSTPSVLTVDNEEATNLAGQEIPFRTGSFTTTTDGASNPFQTINRQNVGVELTVKPHIHENLSMRLELKLEVGNVVNSVEAANIGIGSSGFADIVTNNRSLETTILADDRQIILLGGLIQDDFRDVGRRVPLLSRVPVLGRAFRSKRETLTKRHLLMFLRPTVLLSGDEASQMAYGRYDGVYRLYDASEAPIPPQVRDIFDSRN